MQVELGTGWPVFAGVIFMIGGIWNIFAGIEALANKHFFYEGGLAYNSITTWGWIWLILGIVQFLVSFLLLARREAGRIFGVILAGLSMLVWFFNVGTYGGGFVVVFIDALILYGLLAHGEDYS